MKLEKIIPLISYVIEVEGYEWNALRMCTAKGEGITWYESHLVGFSLLTDTTSALLEEQFQARLVGVVV